MDRSKNKNIRVFYRIFPSIRLQWEYVKIGENMQNCYVRRLQDLAKTGVGNVSNYWNFMTDGIFYNNSQEEIYKTVTESLIEKTLKGTDSIIVAFGQSGTGKSLTTHGLEGSFQDVGIAPRLFQELFHIKASLKQAKHISIFMSYAETEGMYLTDLLNPEFNSINSKHMEKIIVRRVKNEKHAWQCLFEGESRKKFTENNNYLSHTLTTILTIHVFCKPTCRTDPIKTQAKIHILDLAAADSMGNFTCAHKGGWEIGHANVIKSQLEQFLLLLQENIVEHISVAKRLNILFAYLKDSLHSSSILKFIGHINTDKENLTITLSMLRFGHIIRRLKPEKLRYNVKENEDSKYTLLKEKYDQLYTEKIINSMVTNTNLANNIVQERVKHMKNIGELFLTGTINELSLFDSSDAHTVLSLMRENYQKLQQDYQSTKESLEHAILLESTRITSKQDSSSLTREGRKPSKKSITSRSLTSRSSMLDGEKHKQTSRDRSDVRRSRDSIKDHLSLHSSRHSRVGSGANARRSSKRHSGASTTSTIKEELGLPDSIPNRDSIWRLFIAEPEYKYNELIEKLEEQKEAAENCNRKYFEQIEVLQNSMKTIDLRKEQLRNCKMSQLFLKGEEFDEYANPIKTNLEMYCTENLKAAEISLIEQQEMVLGFQTELQIAVDNLHNTRRDINDRFQQYCRDKYQTVLPSLPLEASDKEMDKETKEQMDENSLMVKSVELCIPPQPPDPKLSESFQQAKEFDLLKRQLKVEIRKRKQKLEKSKQWITTAKLN